MRKLPWVKGIGIGIGLCGAFFLACSSGSSNGDGSGGGSGGGSGSSSGGTIQTSCGGLDVLFSPMYSAYDGTHTFQVPAIVNNASDPTAISWTASDTTAVQLAPDPTTGIVMITVLKAGAPVTIQATDKSGNCGQSTLNVTAATPEQWQNGSDRYNNGYILPGRGDGGGPPQGFDAGALAELACINCHGDNSNPNAPYKDVAHTPEQTGGFSDTDLVNIFENGTIPSGLESSFDPSVICGTGANCTMQVALARWGAIHNWSMTDDEKTGIIVYLRSLTPAAQTGSSNFGGKCDGGKCPRPDGGGYPHDGGGNHDGGGQPGQPDSSTGADDSGNSPD